MDIFNYESSSIKWCESAYTVSIYVCEFLNTITSFSYVYFSYLYFNNLRLYDNTFYLTNNNNKIYLNILAFVSFCIGLFSAYFHCTLSLSGQLLDEYSILALVCLFDLNFTKFIMAKILILICLFFLFPVYNRILLFTYGFYNFKCVIANYLKNKNLKQRKLFELGVISFFLSVTSWVIDYFLCDNLIISIHWLWHILSSYSLYVFSNYLLINLENLNFDYYYFKIVPKINIQNESSNMLI